MRRLGTEVLIPFGVFRVVIPRYIASWGRKGRGVGWNVL